MSRTPLKILLVDDEPDVLEFMSYSLKKEGYSVFTASNGKDALNIAKQIDPRLIVLDVMMPEMDGMETCREFRSLDQFKNTLIIFLTARDEDYSQIAGFEMGADDYVTKPVKPRVFLSRLQALLRRGETESKRSSIRVGNIELDEDKYLVYKDNGEINLPRKEFQLLQLLMSKPGRVFTRDEIMNKVWGTETIVGDRTIDVHIRKLREKIGDDYFKTIKGVGYKFDL
jgi:two-component system alkaline phosphatase synthesis response regulator PhoP